MARFNLSEISVILQLPSFVDLGRGWRKGFSKDPGPLCSVRGRGRLSGGKRDTQGSLRRRAGASARRGGVLKNAKD